MRFPSIDYTWGGCPRLKYARLSAFFFIKEQFTSLTDTKSEVNKANFILTITYGIDNCRFSTK